MIARDRGGLARSDRTVPSSDRQSGYAALRAVRLALPKAVYMLRLCLTTNCRPSRETNVRQIRTQAGKCGRDARDPMQ